MGLRFRAWGFMVQVLGWGLSSWFRVQGLGFQGFGFGAQLRVFGLQSFGLRVLGFRVYGLGFAVQSFKVQEFMVYPNYQNRLVSQSSYKLYIRANARDPAKCRLWQFKLGFRMQRRLFCKDLEGLWFYAQVMVLSLDFLLQQGVLRIMELNNFNIRVAIRSCKQQLKMNVLLKT